LAIAGTFFLTGGAAILFVRAKTWPCRATAVVLAALPACGGNACSGSGAGR